MPKIVPAILEKDLASIKAKVKLVKPYVDLIQLDVMDGEFVPNVTYNDPEGIAELGVKVEPHLMVMHPEFCIAKWNLPNVETIFVHIEAATNLAEIIRLIKAAGKRVGVAINPTTSTYDLDDYLTQIDCVMVMGVSPGFSGQGFQYDALEKIKHFKKIRPELLIAVDGGVNFDTKDQILAAGADILAVNSVLFAHPEQIKENLEKLKS